VIFQGSIQLSSLSSCFKPVVEETSDWLIKFAELYLETKGNQAIVPVVTVEEGYPQSYYVKISSRGEGARLSVRLDPSTDPIKTRGVKRSIALIAETVKAACPGIVVESHNLQDLFGAQPLR
jgi:hypothetical protein